MIHHSLPGQMGSLKGEEQNNEKIYDISVAISTLSTVRTE